MYHRIIQCLLKILLLLYATASSHAQLSAVRATINIIPPYSVYLSDYVSPSANKLLVNIILADPNPVDLMVKLKITIQGEGITLETKPSLLPTPLRLSTGVNTISTADLAPYFDPANFNFQGLDKAQFIKSGRLKEGIYQFCVEVLEYNRGIKLSDKACATAWLLLNNPPMWNLPEANQVVPATNPQNMIFNWTPQHTGSPNSAFTVAYEFTLVEIWPISRNGNDAINSQLPLFRTTTEITSLLYGPAEPPLIPGRKYAIRLKAYDKEGRDLFINSGYSEVRIFTFGEECKPPLLQNPVVHNFQKAKLSWSGIPSHTDYTIRYRPVGEVKDAPWYMKNALVSYAYLDSLTHGIAYEYSVKANCGSIASDYSAPQNFTLPARPLYEVECKDLPYVVPPSSSVQKASLKIGDKVNIGDFEMQITEVSGGNGLFSGKGIIAVPMLNNIQLRTSFKDILINENNIVLAGVVSADRASMQAIDPATKQQIYEGMNAIDQKFTDINSYLDKTNSIITQVNTVIKDAPEAAKNLLEKGKEQLEKGKQLIANGNTEAGKELIEKGKKQIKDGLGKIKDGVGVAVAEGVDGLKALFQKAINEKSTALSKDSTALTKSLAAEEDEFEKLKKNYEGELYEISTDEVWEEVTADLGDNNGVLEVVQESEGTTAFKTPLLNKLNIAANKRQQSQLDLEDLISRLKLLQSYKVPDSNALEEIIKVFKNESVALLKKYALDKLTGKKAEELETQIKKFIDNKIQEAILLIR